MLSTARAGLEALTTTRGWDIDALVERFVNMVRVGLECWLSLLLRSLLLLGVGYWMLLAVVLVSGGRARALAEHHGLVVGC